MSKRSSPRPSSMGRRPIETADGQDVHTGWYKIMCTYSRSKQRAKAKRRDRRRERAQGKQTLRQESQDAF